jgi:hypothetical protein
LKIPIWEGSRVLVLGPPTHLALSPGRVASIWVSPGCKYLVSGTPARSFGSPLGSYGFLREGAGCSFALLRTPLGCLGVNSGCPPGACGPWGHWGVAYEVRWVGQDRLPGPLDVGGGGDAGAHMAGRRMVFTAYTHCLLICRWAYCGPTRSKCANLTQKPKWVHMGLAPMGPNGIMPRPGPNEKRVARVTREVWSSIACHPGFNTLGLCSTAQAYFLAL